MKSICTSSLAFLLASTALASPVLEKRSERWYSEACKGPGYNPENGEVTELENDIDMFRTNFLGLHKSVHVKIKHCQPESAVKDEQTQSNCQAVVKLLENDAKEKRLSWGQTWKQAPGLQLTLKEKGGYGDINECVDALLEDVYRAAKVLDNGVIEHWTRGPSSKITCWVDIDHVQ